MDWLRQFWLAMFTLPWRDAGFHGKSTQILYWVLGWCWSIPGLILGAIIAPAVLSQYGLADASHQDWAIFTVAALTALIVQIFCFVAFIIIGTIGGLVGLQLWLRFRRTPLSFPDDRGVAAATSSIKLSAAGAAVVTIVGECAAIWWYIMTQAQGTHQGLVATYALGGFIVKAVVFPAIKGFVGGFIIKHVLAWLRRDKAKE